MVRRKKNVPVPQASWQAGGYILIGKVDLLMGQDNKLELLDFKTSPRPKDSPELIAAYERQLCTYAHILEGRHGRHVDRLLLYWTSEPRKENALMALPYDPTRVEEAGRHFDETVRRIQAGRFGGSDRNRITGRMGRAAANGHRIMEKLFDHPIVTVATVREWLDVTPAGANNLVNRLVDVGVLREITVTPVTGTSGSTPTCACSRNRRRCAHDSVV